ncbi:hypothetical protein DXG03_003869 [Asterophora parasitica]|uniref:HMG box domain-containing protein n=1 Tax=Asterophora parasitica TaxID=117018 RepID=A0A9P7KD74_9AGAR|nr:hypothetical protein DXG03_003869 [Asterophora parasitica]
MPPARTTNDEATIPRPPNSWILYRSAMVALLGPPPDGETRSQAEVSRMISRMWKTEAPAVRAEYEHRAEQRKIEHAAKYPNYRYTPKSKELKQELKQAKARGKGKAKRGGSEVFEPAESSSRGSSQSLPLTSHKYPYYIQDGAKESSPDPYTSGGPSPPMSAAESPSPESFQSSPQIQSAKRVEAQPVPTQNVNSHYRPHTAIIHSQPTSVVQQPAVPSEAATTQYRAVSNDPQLPQTGVYYPQPQYQQPPVPQMLQADQVGQLYPQQYAFVNSTVPQEDAVEPQDLLSFHLNQYAGQNLAAWAFENPEFQAGLDQFLNTTSGDCYQMQINPDTQQTVGETPVGPLEVELGQLQYDFSSLDDWNNQPPLDMGGYQNFFDNTVTQNDAHQNLAGPSSSIHPSPTEGLGLLPAIEPQQTFDMSNFVNFDPAFDYRPPSPVVEEAPVVPAPAPYVPPSGAAHNNKRRVAASWNPSFAMTDPIDV